MILRYETGQTDRFSILGVPASVAGRVVCALVIDAAQVARRWPQPLVERLQLVSEILGAALQRHRHESLLRSSVAEIERLNARLEADNVYLKEEIKNYHDFDHIVGESDPLRLALARLTRWPRPTPACCCWARPAPARNCSPGRCTSAAGAMRGRWCG